MARSIEGKEVGEEFQMDHVAESKSSSKSKEAEVDAETDADLEALRTAALYKRPEDMNFKELSDLADPDKDLTPQQVIDAERRLLRKLDWTLIPWLCLLYLLSFLDRTNIGNAKIANLQADLNHMTAQEYNTALTIFFISYSIFEPLSNVLLKRLRPSIFIPIIMMLWGLCMTLMGTIYNFSGLMAARWFLGLCEAGLFPGISYYLSCWYKRSEFGLRMAIFFSAAAFSGSFGGLLAAAISKMEGVGGAHGWQWIFILEGLATVIIGAASFFFVHDFPDTAKFLSEADTIRTLRRLREDQQSSYKKEQWAYQSLVNAVTDYKTYFGMIIYMGCDMPLYAFSLFLPTIIKDLGYTSTVAQLLTVPVYATAAVATIFVGWAADRTGRRGLANLIVAPIGIIGFIILIVADSAKLRYAGCFLGALGIYPCISNTISWMSNNIEGVYKRGIILGIFIGWGNLNGIVSSNIYNTDKDGPRFIPGHSVVLAYMAVFLWGGSLVLYLLLKRENAKRVRGERDHWIEGLTVQEIRNLGDKRPDFFYTL